MTATAQATATGAAYAGSRWRRVRGPAVVIAGLGLATVALHLRDPHQQGSWGICPSAALGFSCPGCGGLRAMNDLTHGQVGAAASSNLMLLAVMPVVIFLLVRWFGDAWSGRERDHDTRRVVGATAVYGVALLAFTVLRNLPAGSWLAP